jgi:hypothetical protein
MKGGGRGRRTNERTRRKPKGNECNKKKTETGDPLLAGKLSQGEKKKKKKKKKTAKTRMKNEE